MKKRRNISRSKKAKIHEILTDDLQASSQLHAGQAGVTEQREKLLKDLSKMRTRFSRVVARDRVPIVVLDSVGYIREVNEGACHLLGFANNKLTDLAFNYVVAPKDIDLFKGHLQKCQSNSAETIITNLRLRTSDKRLIAVQLISSFLHRNGADHFQTAIVDGAAVQRREEELKDVRDFADSIVQMIRQPMVVLDDTMQVVTVNRHLMRVFNLAPGRAVKTFFDKLLKLPANGGTLRGWFAAVLSSPRSIEDIRLELPASNGPLKVRRGESPRKLLITAKPFHRKTQNVSLLLVSIEDITLLRNADEQLRAANQELEERTRLLQRSNEEMQAFSYSIAHDLRAPLRAIQGMSRILMEDFGSVLGEEGHDYFGRIVNAAQRMDDLIRDLLDYARMTTVQLPLGPVDGEAIWFRVAANFAAEIEDKMATVEKKDAFPSVWAHRTVVELALSNLLANALKFLPKGSKPYVQLWTERVSKNRVRFNIRDNGIGIAPEHQRRIFRVFERLHPPDTYPGTGIGLAIVRKGIERVGGTLGLDSKPGEGSTFWFELQTA